MKLFISTLILLSAFSLKADEGATAPKSCNKKAAKAVAEKVEKRKYDQDGLDAYECLLSPNGLVVVCGVSASKGSGDAIDSYQVVLDKTCTAIYRVELTGEE